MSRHPHTLPWPAESGPDAFLAPFQDVFRAEPHRYSRDPEIDAAMRRFFAAGGRVTRLEPAASVEMIIQTGCVSRVVRVSTAGDEPDDPEPLENLT